MIYLLYPITGGHFYDRKTKRTDPTVNIAVQKSDVKDVRIFPHVPQIWEQSGSMPVPITHLFTAIT